jgi:hypothetical protein
MPYLFVGAGQAGSAIVDEIFDHKDMSKIATPLVFNSTIRDLQNLSNIESDNWQGVAEQHGLVQGGTPGFEERVTGGFGRNPVRADEVAHDNYDEFVDVLDQQLIGEGDTERAGQSADIPFAFVCFGLGGGTGCGIAPHICRAISEYSDDTTGIIAICVLPNTEGPVDAEDEDVNASRQAWNTQYGLDRIENVVDGIVLVDNQRLSYHEAAEGKFTEYNEYIASSIVDLVSGSALERIDRGQFDVDPPIIDIQDIITSLSFDVQGINPEPGYASLGRSVMMTKSLRGYLVPFLGKKEIDTATLSQLTGTKQTVADIDLEEAEKAIGLLRAPSRYIVDSEYRIDTSVLRRFLGSKCDEVNMGATLTKRNLTSFTTLFTFRREDLSRIAEIEALATEYEAESEARVA